MRAARGIGGGQALPAILAALLLALPPAAHARLVTSLPAPTAQMTVTEDGVPPLGGVAYVSAIRNISTGVLTWDYPRPPDMPSSFFDDAGDPCDLLGSNVSCNAPPGLVVVRGGEGADRLQYGSHKETALNLDIQTGGGNDQVAVGGFGSRSIIEGGPGTDTIQARFVQGVSSNETDDGWRIDLATGAAFPKFGTAAAFTFTGFENIDQELNGAGARGTHELLGNDGPNMITGQHRYIDPNTGQPYIGARGDDTINGRGGDDILNGGGGDDRLTGGAGADRFNCGAGVDTVTDATAEDTVAADCENLNRLQVALEAGTIGTNDVFDLALTLQHTGAAGTPAIGALAFPAGNGLVQNNFIAGSGPVPALFPILGPAPGYPAALEPAQATKHTLAYAIETPGTTLLQTRVTGTDASGGKHDDDAAVRIDAAYRQPTRQELDGMLAGALITLLDSSAELRERLAARLSQIVRDRLKRSKGAKGLLAPTPFERMLARRLGLPDDALAWMPNATRSSGSGPKRKPGRLEVAWAFTEATGREMKKVGAEAVDRTLVTPFVFWRDFLFEPSDGHRARMTAEMSRMVGDGSVAVGGALGTAKDFYTSPARMQAAWSELPQIRAEAQQAINKLDHDFSDAVLRWDKLMQDDPLKGAEQFGKLLGRIEGEVAIGWLEAAAGGKVNQGLQLFSKARKGAGLTAEVTEVAGTTRRVSAPVKGATPLAKTPSLGNLSPQQISRFQEIAERVGKKFGVNLEIQARPINEYAARVKGGIGKVEAVPTKNLTPDDVLLGAPEGWVGQTAYYRPRLPKSFDKLPKDVQQRFKLRYDEKLKEYRQFAGEVADPTGKTAKVHKALEKGGAEFKLGKNGKVRMELVKTTHESGAVLIRYKKLVVNGKPVFTGKPRPIVSDVDFNAVVDAGTGRHLPASIRGQVELEVMREFAKAADEGIFPFGFHGWTHSGFDIASSDFRHILKYMLMYLPEDEAARVAAKYAKVYGVSQQEFLEGYTRGKLLVKITATDAVLGPGAGGL